MSSCTRRTGGGAGARTARARSAAGSLAARMIKTRISQHCARAAFSSLAVRIARGAARDRHCSSATRPHIAPRAFPSPPRTRGRARPRGRARSDRRRLPPRSRSIGWRAGRRSSSSPACRRSARTTSASSSRSPDASRPGSGWITPECACAVALAPRRRRSPSIAVDRGRRPRTVGPPRFPTRFSAPARSIGSSSPSERVARSR